MNTGERLRSIRVHRGLTQKELAKAANISEISVRKYESGERQPKHETVHQLAKVLDVNESWLKEGIESEIRKEESFVKYLIALGYSVTFANEVLEWHHEDIVDDGIIMGKAEVTDKETYSVSITNGNCTVNLDEAQFENLKTAVKKCIEFELFKASK